MTKRKIGNVWIIGIAIIGLLSSCMKDGDVFNDYEQYERDVLVIENYVKVNLPKAIKDSTGIWFELIKEGEGENFQYKTETVTDPRTGQKVVRALAPIITVRYTTKLLDGTVAQSEQKPEGISVPFIEQPASWQLAFLPYEIPGVTTQIKGLTRNGLKPGSIIRFVTPSFYAYGNVTIGKIPANSPLDYTIEVLKMENKTDNK